MPRKVPKNVENEDGKSTESLVPVKPVMKRPKNLKLSTMSKRMCSKNFKIEDIMDIVDWEKNMDQSTPVQVDSKQKCTDECLDRNRALLYGKNDEYKKTVDSMKKQLDIVFDFDKDDVYCNNNKQIVCVLRNKSTHDVNSYYRTLMSQNGDEEDVSEW